MGEDIQEAARREVVEETGFSPVFQLIDTGFSYEYVHVNRHHVEFVFGLEVDGSDPALSSEHNAFCWCIYAQALKLLHWPDNKKGLRELAKILRMRGFRLGWQ